jgi:hypothetical protein
MVSRRHQTCSILSCSIRPGRRCPGMNWRGSRSITTPPVTASSGSGQHIGTYRHILGPFFLMSRWIFEHQFVLTWVKDRLGRRFDFFSREKRQGWNNSAMTPTSSKARDDRYGIERIDSFDDSCWVVSTVSRIPRAPRNGANPPKPRTTSGRRPKIAGPDPRSWMPKAPGNRPTRGPTARSTSPGRKRPHI